MGCTGVTGWCPNGGVYTAPNVDEPVGGRFSKASKRREMSCNSCDLNFDSLAAKNSSSKYFRYFGSSREGKSPTTGLSSFDIVIELTHGNGKGLWRCWHTAQNLTRESKQYLPNGGSWSPLHLLQFFFMCYFSIVLVNVPQVLNPYMEVHNRAPTPLVVSAGVSISCQQARYQHTHTHTSPYKQWGEVDCSSLYLYWNILIYLSPSRNLRPSSQCDTLLSGGLPIRLLQSINGWINHHRPTAMVITVDSYFTFNRNNCAPNDSAKIIKERLTLLFFLKNVLNSLEWRT